MQVDYHAKYLKYKQKYLDLKEEMIGSGDPEVLKKLQICKKKKKDDIAKRTAMTASEQIAMCDFQNSQLYGSDSSDSEDDLLDPKKWTVETHKAFKKVFPAIIKE